MTKLTRIVHRTTGQMLIEFVDEVQLDTAALEKGGLVMTGKNAVGRTYTVTAPYSAYVVVTLEEGR